MEGGYIALLEGVGAIGSTIKKHIYGKREERNMRRLAETGNININVKQFVISTLKCFVNNFEVVWTIE